MIEASTSILMDFLIDLSKSKKICQYQHDISTSHGYYMHMDNMKVSQSRSNNSFVFVFFNQYLCAMWIPHGNHAHNMWVSHAHSRDKSFEKNNVYMPHGYHMAIILVLHAHSKERHFEEINVCVPHEYYMVIMWTLHAHSEEKYLKRGQCLNVSHMNIIRLSCAHHVGIMCSLRRHSLKISNQNHIKLHLRYSKILVAKVVHKSS